MEHEEKVEKIEDVVTTAHELMDKVLTCMDEEDVEMMKSKVLEDLEDYNVDIDNFKNYLNERNVLDVVNFDGTVECYFSYYDIGNMLFFISEIMNMVLNHKVEHMFDEFLKHEKENRTLTKEEEIAINGYINTHYREGQIENNRCAIPIGIEELLDTEIYNFEDREDFMLSVEKAIEYEKHEKEMTETLNNVSKHNSNKERDKSNSKED